MAARPSPPRARDPSRVASARRFYRCAPYHATYENARELAALSRFLELPVASAVDAFKASGRNDAKRANATGGATREFYEKLAACSARLDATCIRSNRWHDRRDHLTYAPALRDRRDRSARPATTAPARAALDRRCGRGPDWPPSAPKKPSTAPTPIFYERAKPAVANPRVANLALPKLTKAARANLAKKVAARPN